MGRAVDWWLRHQTPSRSRMRSPSRQSARTAPPILPHRGAPDDAGVRCERSTQVRRQQPGGHRLAAVALVADVARRRSSSNARRSSAATLAWMRAGRISSMTQYFDTTSRSSSSVTALTGPSAGIACTVEDQHEVRRSRRGGPHDRLLVALAQFHRHRVEQRAVDDGAEPAVVAGERADVGDVEGGVVQAAPGGLGAGELDGRRRTGPDPRW